MRDFALEVYFSKWEFTAKHHMTASDIESMTIADLLSMSDQADLESFDDQLSSGLRGTPVTSQMSSGMVSAGTTSMLGWKFLANT